ncbi:dihydrodipicolinate reductase C-terminal domain-containing protein [Pinibacter soli]|uniref:Dihydrodipicolinate reductase C-terminal domain-containing protein n=1 Tax=Pinibacter soli TaxID=3044211 RepID=A0ABT6RIL8_9BACT|nr:dihydrodipicolinate reductase C-terminal domain-containing protein [Pinibacter soli]MDI3322413.1 dihydrodipicolinate reductase C-terminal domain-containing protein [Pinibacter soli]
MKIFIAGSGKLASAILSASISFPSCEVQKWETDFATTNEKAIVVHAGSGRQLDECIAFCKKTGSIFVELSTGLSTENMEADFTLIVCPNTSILLLKTMNMLKLYGQYFSKDKISIIESHQSAKQSVPGTAYNFANSLNFPANDIQSIRDAETQLNEVGISAEYLGKHAYHKIIIEDGPDQVIIETKVLGHDSYVNGVKKIINAVLSNSFEKRKYNVLELIDRNML